MRQTVTGAGLLATLRLLAAAIAHYEQVIATSTAEGGEQFLDEEMSALALVYQDAQAAVALLRQVPEIQS